MINHSIHKYLSNLQKLNISKSNLLFLCILDMHICYMGEGQWLRQTDNQF